MTRGNLAVKQALTPYWRERYEERCAIKEYDGKMPRLQAEREAEQEIYQLMKEDSNYGGSNTA